MDEYLDQQMWGEKSKRSRSHTRQLRVVGKEQCLIKICIRTGVVKAMACCLFEILEPLFRFYDGIP